VVTAITARTRFTRLLADASAAPNAQLFARDVLEEWGLGALAEDACTGLDELIGWVLANGSHVQVEITLVWDEDLALLFTEVVDHGEALPAEGDVPVSWCEDRGAERNWRGRVLWASYRTGRPQLLPGGAR